MRNRAAWQLDLKAHNLIGVILSLPPTAPS
jgi:hypothetical protein